MLLLVVLLWLWLVFSTLASEARSAGCWEMRRPSILSKKPKVRPAGMAWMFPLPLRVGTSLRVAVASKLPRLCVLCVWSVGREAEWLGEGFRKKAGGERQRCGYTPPRGCSAECHQVRALASELSRTRPTASLSPPDSSMTKDIPAGCRALLGPIFGLAFGLLGGRPSRPCVVGRRREGMSAKRAGEKD